MSNKQKFRASISKICLKASDSKYFHLWGLDKLFHTVQLAIDSDNALTNARACVPM
jgi:hypothetical protein